MYPEYKRNYTIFSAADAKVWEMKKKKKKKKKKKTGDWQDSATSEHKERLRLNSVSSQSARGKSSYGEIYY